MMRNHFPMSKNLGGDMKNQNELARQYIEEMNKRKIQGIQPMHLRFNYFDPSTLNNRDS